MKFIDLLLFIAFLPFGFSNLSISPTLKIGIFIIFSAFFIIFSSNLKKKGFFIYSSIFQKRVLSAYLIFFVGLIISSLFSVYENTLSSFFYSALWLVKFFCLKYFSQKKNILELLNLFSLALIGGAIIELIDNSSLLQGILKIFSTNNFLSSAGSLYRSTITEYHPNELASILGIAFLFFVMRYINKFLISKSFKFNLKNYISELIYAFLLILTFSALLITSSRSVYLSVLISLFLALVYYLRVNRKNILKVIIPLTLITYFFTRFIQLDKLFLLNDVARGVGSGFTGRGITWSIIFKEVGLLGYGYVYDPALVLIDSFHSSFLAILYQSGYIFGSFILFIYLLTFLKIFNILLDKNPDKELGLKNMIQIIFGSYLIIHGFFENFLITLSNIDSFVFLICIFGRYEDKNIRNKLYEYYQPIA